MFYVGKEKRIEILINDLNELVRKGYAMWLELGEYEFGLDRLSKCPTQTWYGIHQMLYSLEPWGVMKESKESVRKSIKESSVGYYIYSKSLDNKYAYCDKSKFTEEGFYLIEDYMLDAIHIFETEKEAEKFIDEYLNRFMVKKENVVIAEYPSNKRGFFESKKSARKSIKESSVRVVTFQQIVDSRFDDISKGEEILDDRKNEIVKLCGNDFSVYTTDRRFVEFDDDTQWRETYYVRKNNNNVVWNDLYKIVNSVKPCRYEFDKINDSHFESKKSARKSLKESVEFSKEKDIYIAQIKDSSISFAYTPIDTNDDFNGYFVFDGDDVIEYLNWKGADVDDMLKAFDDFEKVVKKYTSKEDAKIIIKDFHDKLGI